MGRLQGMQNLRLDTWIMLRMEMYLASVVDLLRV